MAKKQRRAYPQHPLHPYNWGQGLMLATVWALGQLPWPMATALGRGLGRAGYYLAHTRRRIARRNLELCFPGMDARTREQMVKDNFMFTGKGIMELAVAWYGRTGNVNRIPLELHGLDNLRQAQADGSPIILLGGHFTALEICARLLRSHLRFAAVYKPMRRKPVLDRALRRARARNCGEALPGEDVRAIVRALKVGTPVWYAGDQDYGRKHSVFAPFFDVPAATITALSRFARLGKARVIPIRYGSKPDHSGYEIAFGPAFEHYPEGDDVRDATRMNEEIEAAVRRYPAQYLWIHRRFKRQEERGKNLYATKP